MLNRIVGQMHSVFERDSPRPGRSIPHVGTVAI
jgi:hypothetical protein